MQNTDSILAQLGEIPIGTIIAWIIVITIIVTTISTIVVKLYKLFEKTHKLKEENDNYKELAEKHTKQLNEFGKTLNEIKCALDTQKEVNLKQLRHELVNSCEMALTNNKITTSSLCSLEEMYEEYRDVFNGNGYVKTLMGKVRKLEIDKYFDD